MDSYPWYPFLQRWSVDILNSALATEMAYMITDNMRAALWLGTSGANETALATTEQRLGMPLPPSYRSFLATSNGWSVVTQLTGHLWSTTEVGWFHERDPELFAMYTQIEEDMPDAEYFVYTPQQDHARMRTRYLYTALQVSNPHYLDGDFYLLNPAVQTPDGEWEAWILEAESCERYRSFWDLMQSEYRTFLFINADE